MIIIKINEAYVNKTVIKPGKIRVMINKNCLKTKSLNHREAIELKKHDIYFSSRPHQIKPLPQLVKFGICGTILEMRLISRI